MGPSESFGKLRADIGVSTYDAVRWTDWVPIIKDVRSDCGLSSLRQVTPRGAAGATITKVPALESHVLVYFPRGPRKVEFEVAGKPIQTGFSPWGLYYLPAGVDSVWRSTPEAAQGVFQLHLVDDQFRSVLSEIGLDSVDPAPSLLGSDAQLSALGRIVFSDLRESVVQDRLSWSSYAALVATRIARLSRKLTGGRDLRPAPADWRLRRAIEYLEAHLSQSVTLDELARQVDLSQSHLVKLFQDGLGSPPHRWLMQRRIERACAMLSDPRTSVLEIALTCGFASSQHFATVFRRHVGTSPSRYRRVCCS